MIKCREVRNERSLSFRGSAPDNLPRLKMRFNWISGRPAPGVLSADECAQPAAVPSVETFIFSWPKKPFSGELASKSTGLGGNRAPELQTVNPNTNRK